MHIGNIFSGVGDLNELKFAVNSPIKADNELDGQNSMQTEVESSEGNIGDSEIEQESNNSNSSDTNLKIGGPNKERSNVEEEVRQLREKKKEVRRTRNVKYITAKMSFGEAAVDGEFEGIESSRFDKVKDRLCGDEPFYDSESPESKDNRDFIDLVAEDGATF